MPSESFNIKHNLNS